MARIISDIAVLICDEVRTQSRVLLIVDPSLTVQ